MPQAQPQTYLADIVKELQTHWPQNRLVNVVCHGHSVPAGYFATPRVDSVNAYPHRLGRGLKQRFPFAVVNVIVTAIGGENSVAGAARFDEQVLNHRPDVLTLDYGLNDRGVGLKAAREAWASMIRRALDQGSKVILLTPTLDQRVYRPEAAPAEREVLAQHAGQIRDLAEQFDVGLVDSFAAFHRYMQQGELSDLMSWANHPNGRGHKLVARELMRWFPAG